MGEAGEVVVVLRTQVLDWYVRDHGTGLKVRVSESVITYSANAICDRFVGEGISLK